MLPSSALARLPAAADVAAALTALAACVQLTASYCSSIRCPVTGALWRRPSMAFGAGGGTIGGGIGHHLRAADSFGGARVAARVFSSRWNTGVVMRVLTGRGSRCIPFSLASAACAAAAMSMGSALPTFAA